MSQVVRLAEEADARVGLRQLATHPLDGEVGRGVVGDDDLEIGEILVQRGAHGPLQALGAVVRRNADAQQRALQVRAAAGLCASATSE